jgi:hypothetical protein
MSKVTTLEPRTLHQPGKLQKLSKNEFVLRLLFLESIKMTGLYVLSVQASAARPQAGELKVVQRPLQVDLRPAETMNFSACGGLQEDDDRARVSPLLVKIAGRTARDTGFARMRNSQIRGRIGSYA